MGILDRIFPEYTSYSSSVFVQTLIELLKAYPEPEELAKVDSLAPFSPPETHKHFTHTR